MTKKFTHLHLHTEYSLLDGVGKIDDYLDRAKELGMTSLAITDHGNMFGAIEFYKKSLKKGIKPIIGIETYICPHSIYSEEGKKERKNFHLVLLAKNEIGYKNIMKLSSIAYTDGFYYRPRVDKELLKKYSEGIIALSSCMNGEIANLISKEAHIDNINSAIEDYIGIFGRENFYIELQSNGFTNQEKLNFHLIEYAEKHSLEIVITNDTHYVNSGDHTLQDILLCIGTGSKIEDEKRMKIDTEELYLKDREQILDMFKQFPKQKIEKALENTEIISSKCNLKIEFGIFKFPEYPLEKPFKTIEEFLRFKVFEGLEKRYSGLNEEILERAEYELSVINSMGFAGYFVVVWDFIFYAKSQGIFIGPGRGSAAGSLIAYALEITDLDPLEYNLLFERFLNPERISMPDIDIDICQLRRNEVIDYVIKKYGWSHVAQIITFGRLKARAAVRDVGRVLNIPLFKIDALAKLLSSDKSISQSLKENKEIQKIYVEDFDLQKVLDFSRRLENTVRHASIHAAGIVITKSQLTEDVPLYKDNKDGAISTQYQMKELEELGILKMDFLGLRNLSILEKAVEYVKNCHGIHINLNKLPLNNKKVYQMLSHGDTSGVFQLESPGIRRLLQKLKPDKFQDLIAVLALYRPGPLGSGMVDNFINCKNGNEKIVYPDPSLEEILNETYGVILYQEQVMKIATLMADYTLGEADNLRRAMGKKDFKIMESNRNMFLERAIKKGYTLEKAEEIFFLIDKFAGYGFNKSHSAAYALIAYWTAYFKANYPVEAYAALMSSMDHIDNIAYYVEDAKQHKIKILPPDVNNPNNNFIIEKDKIGFSISGIKNIGSSFVEKLILESKENGIYKNFENFVTRTKKIGLNKKMLQSLILSGALDNLSGNRKQKFHGIEKVLDFAERNNKEDDIQQMNLFGTGKPILNRFNFENLEEYNLTEILDFEKEFLGFYLSAHPLDEFKNFIKAYRLRDISELNVENIVHHVKTYGIIREIRKLVTKKEERIMALFNLEDYSDFISVTIFPNEFEKYLDIIQEGKAVYIEGLVQMDTFNGKENKKLILKSISPLDTINSKKNFKCYFLIEEEDKDKFNRLKQIIESHPGDIPVIFAVKNGKEKEIKTSKFRVSPSKNFIEEVVQLLGIEKIAIQ
ncbi:MAG: DNA polymerase III subunit alpha [Fusobacteriaceae bacterium]